MRSLTWALTDITGVLTERIDLDADRYTERTSCRDPGRRWPTTSQGEEPGTNSSSQPLEGINPANTMIVVSRSLEAHRRRQWHPTPVLLPGKSHGQRSLVGCSPWDRWGSDMTERLHSHFSLSCIGEGNGNSLQCSCWRIPGMGEPGGLPPMESHRVGHNWSDLAAPTAYIYIYIYMYMYKWSQVGFRKHHCKQS